MPSLTLQLYSNGRWCDAATFSVEDETRGHLGLGILDYHLDYVAKHLSESRTVHALSCNYSVSFSNYRQEPWPAFLLDILPSGAGRRQWLQRQGLKDEHSSDWALLGVGAGSPPGNLRIKEAVLKHAELIGPDASGLLHKGAIHPGFNRSDIIQRGEHFIEYAHQHDAATAGASDVQGEAPKFLLVEDRRGRWHAEGAIPDAQVAKHWLVKFPRGATQSDRDILRNECAYLEVARALGLHVGEALQYEGDALFIPRFDRKVKPDYIERFGVESLCSAAGISQYGASPAHELLLSAITCCSHSQSTDIVEYICRDIINIILGNKDNHARNSAILKSPTGHSALSPLFDFAPMYLDNEGIARVCRWHKDYEQAGQPIWPKLVEHIEASYPTCNIEHLRARIRTLSTQLERLEEHMISAGVDDQIIHTRLLSLARQLPLLREV